MAKKTALYDRLGDLGAKFTEFCGFYMPVQFERGILAEHKAVRTKAGIFDVSHMGEFVLEGENAERDAEKLFTNGFLGMPDGRARYTLMCDFEGGVIDDLLVYRADRNKFYIVVNASNIEKDREWMLKNMTFESRLRDISDEISMIAVQGPNAEALVKRLFSLVPARFYTFLFSEFKGLKAAVSRTGYTGEDGFEIYAENSAIGPIFDECIRIKDEYGAELCGLGARDTLRLESAMPLYGHEMSGETLATELRLDSFIKLGKEAFIGRDALLSKPPKYARIGLKLLGRGIAREACPVFSGDTEIGVVTSGSLSPSLGYAVAMARVKSGIELFDLSVSVRGKSIEAELTEMPFYKRNY